MIKPQLKLFFTVMVFAGMTGCANTSALDSLRDELQQVRGTAEGAAADAKAAREEATAASRAAADAQATADEARSMAQNTDAKIDRMFKKAMYK